MGSRGPDKGTGGSSILDIMGGGIHRAGGFREPGAADSRVRVEAKAGAVVKMLSGIEQTQRSVRDEINKSITEQFQIIANIQEILDIQRQYISGYESQERKPVNLRNIVNDSLAMLFTAIDKKAIIVDSDIPAELPLIKGDRTKLMQVILNILKNSIEDIGIQEGKKTISIRAHTTADLLVLEIGDGGKGFDGAIAGPFSHLTASHRSCCYFPETTHPFSAFRSGSGAFPAQCNQYFTGQPGLYMVRDPGWVE